MSVSVDRGAQIASVRRLFTLIAIAAGLAAFAFAHAEAQNVQTKPSSSATKPPQAAPPAPAPPAPPVPEAPAAKDVPKDNAAELASIWPTIANSTSEAVLGTFMVRAAGTIYADLAKARIEELRAEAAAREAQKQQPTPAPEAGTGTPQGGQTGDTVELPTCDKLWHQRNAIFHSFGYCFGTGKGIMVFGNAGCFRGENEAWLAMGDANRLLVNRIRELEAQNGC